MEKLWIKREGKSNLILFFNGWGMDEAAVEHLDIQGYDLLMLSNYTELKALDENLSVYKSIYVVAWSLGVWGAAQVLAKSKIEVKHAVAINGTLKPIDDKEGISPAIFSGTLSAWTDKTRQRFMMRMIGGNKEYDHHKARFGSRSIESQQVELAAIFKQYQVAEPSHFTFDKALVGTHDAIFTANNQRLSWQHHTQWQDCDMPHYPFAHFSSWQQIISCK